MTPRPLYRWKPLWLGILILIFVSWAWVRSQSHRDGVRYNSGHAGAWYSLESSSGRIWWGKMTDPIPRPPETEFISIENPDPSWFPPPLIHMAKTISTRSGYISSTDISIAHWFLILLFLTAWAALLTWRWRKMNHLPTPP